jgi:hypothetical protein
MQTLTVILGCASSSFPESNDTSIPPHSSDARSSGDALVAVGYYIVFLAAEGNGWFQHYQRCGQAKVSFDRSYGVVPTDVFGRCIDECSSYDARPQSCYSVTSSCWCNPSWGYACYYGGFLGSRSSSLNPHCLKNRVRRTCL